MKRITATHPFAGAVRAASFFSGAADDDAKLEIVEFSLPETFEGLSDDAVVELHDQAVGHFNDIYGDGSSIANDTLETLNALTEAIETLAGEKVVREEASAKLSASAAELAAKVNGTLGVDLEEAAKENQKIEEDENVAQESLAAKRVIKLPARSSHEARTAQETATALANENTSNIKDVLIAVGDGLGLKPGSGVDFDQLGRALDKRLKTFNLTQFQNAAQANRAIREVMSFASLSLDSGNQITSNDRSHIDTVMKAATSKANMRTFGSPPAGGRKSLLASGGWVAPSEIRYDEFLQLEATSGGLTTPEVTLVRGGAQITPGVSFADIFAATGFSYTEADDIQGRYTLDNAPLFVVSTAYALEDHVTLAGGAILRVTVAGTSAAAAPTAPGEGNTVVSGTVTFLQVARSLSVGSKPSYTLNIPNFDDYRLGIHGLIIEAGLLAARGYPEYLADVLRKALVAHFHKMNAAKIAEIAAGSTAVVMPAGQVGAVAPLLTALELQAEHYRDTHRMDPNATLEVGIPSWVVGALRSDLARRQGIDLLDVPNTRIAAWFTQRNLSPQFVQDYQSISTTAVASFTSWPTTVQFLMYAPGGWVKAGSDILTIDTLYDSVNLKNNSFTALFTEEGQTMLKIGPDSRKVTVELSPTGSTNIGEDIARNGTAIV